MEKDKGVGYEVYRFNICYTGVIRPDLYDFAGWQGGCRDWLAGSSQRSKSGGAGFFTHSFFRREFFLFYFLFPQPSLKTGATCLTGGLTGLVAQG